MTRRDNLFCIGRRGALSIIFAISMAAVLAVVGAAINIASLASIRAAMQSAADNAALSGAAAYSLNSSAFNSLAIQTATDAFCDLTNSLPMGATLLPQVGGHTCGKATGPAVTAVTDSYVTGTTGITHGAGISCTGTYLPPAPYNCGFIVTVSSSAKVNTVMPTIFGGTATVAVVGMAVNPFINFAKIFSLPNGMGGGAKYANSVWAYALSLNAAGAPDYTANGGAVPSASTCYNGPDVTNCGAFVMLGNTMYVGKGTGYTPPGQNVIYDNGVVRNPVSPTGITATTPLGIAFESIAGGNYVQYPTGPGVYGYAVVTPGYAPTYIRAPDNCIYPYYKLVYNTVGQVWKTDPTQLSGFSSTLPWSLVSHWFYSSYLGNGLPPSEGEIVAQVPLGEDIPSVSSDPAQSGGNIGGNSTYNATASLTVPTSCPGTTKVGSVNVSNDTLQTTTYPVAGYDNCSVYMTVSSAPTTDVTPPYTGACFTPATTPGTSYANLSCQAYGSNYYTFWWNDMGGAQTDDYNYANGIVQLNCASAAHVLLIN